MLYLLTSIYIQSDITSNTLHLGLNINNMVSNNHDYGKRLSIKTMNRLSISLQ